MFTLTGNGEEKEFIKQDNYNPSEVAKHFV